MSARQIVEVALRLLGLWFVFTAISTFSAGGALYMLDSISTDPQALKYLITTFSIFGVQTVLGIATIYWAPAVARLSYPESVDSQNAEWRVGPGDIYRTACFVLGAYFLVQAANSGTLLAISSVRAPAAGNLLPGGWLRETAQLAVYAISGLLLVFGSQSISDVLVNLRYDPDSIPKQQFSLTVLLVAIVFAAIIMGLIRRMSL